MKALILVLIFILQSCNFVKPTELKFEPNQPKINVAPEASPIFIGNTPVTELPIDQVVENEVEQTPVVEEEQIPAASENEDTQEEPALIPEIIVPIVTIPVPVQEPPVVESPVIVDVPVLSPVIEEPIEIPEIITPSEPTPIPPEIIVVAPLPVPVETTPVKEEIPVVSAPLYPVIPLIDSSLIPAETKQIVSLFIFYASLFNKKVDSSKLIIEIEDKPSSFYIAYCSRVNNNVNPKIKMNREFWKALNSSYKEQLLFHELGHCLLDRPHDGDNFYNPKSLMNVSLFSETTYKNNYDYFIKELFSSLDSSIESPLLFGALYEHIH